MNLKTKQEEQTLLFKFGESVTERAVIFLYLYEYKVSSKQSYVTVTFIVWFLKHFLNQYVEKLEGRQKF